MTEAVKSLTKRVAERTWYHKIDLGDNLVTPGLPFDDLWNMIRSLKTFVNYEGKSVLDIGSWDGMWCFEAEQHGASTVVATDIYPYAYNNFLICREALDSSVIPFYNTSIYDLRRNLEPLFYEAGGTHRVEPRLFDIVQNFGVMYHVRDPMYGIASCRSVLKTGGVMVMETACILDEPKSLMILNGYPREPRIYKDPTTWWAMSISCLEEMLLGSLFQPRMDTVTILNQEVVDGRCIGRVGIVAEAVGLDKNLGLPQVLLDEYMQSFRSPGVDLDHLREGGA